LFGDITSLVNNGLLKVTAFPTTTVDTFVNVTAEPTTREEICVNATVLPIPITEDWVSPAPIKMDVAARLTTDNPNDVPVPVIRLKVFPIEIPAVLATNNWVDPIPTGLLISNLSKLPVVDPVPIVINVFPIPVIGAFVISPVEPKLIRACNVSAEETDCK